MAQESNQSILDAFNSAVGSIDPFARDNVLTDRANAYIKRFGFSTSTLHRDSFEPVFGLDDLQMRLVRAGLLDPKDVTQLATPSIALINAVKRLYQVMDAGSFSSEDEALAAAAAGFIGWDALKGGGRAGRVFEAGAFEATSDAEIDDAITAALQDETGKAKPELVARLRNEWKRLEQERFDQFEGFRRRKFDLENQAAESGQDVTIQRPTLSPEPSAASLVSEAADPLEVQNFQAARFGLSLYRLLGGS